MHTPRTTTMLMLCSALLAGLAAPPAHADGPPSKTYYSNAQALGAGIVRTYVTLDPAAGDETGVRRAPSAVGLEFPASALEGLPAGEAAPVILYFPPQARQTPFQYAMIDWNAHGHPPAMYLLPHFDFHFYIQDLDEVMSIKPGPCSGLDCGDLKTATKTVPAAFLPDGYSDVGAVAPYMGNHLIDLSSPEFKGDPFTRTFIYGAYDGRITFEESMVTRDFLLSNPAECKAFGQPQSYPEPGYWPTKYCTAYNPATNSYRISLEGMTYRP